VRLADEADANENVVVAVKLGEIALSLPPSA
jgi:hypothetical protein